MKKSQNFWDENVERYDPFMRKDAAACAQLAMVHPEKFCRYAEKFLTLQEEEE